MDGTTFRSFLEKELNVKTGEIKQMDIASIFGMAARISREKGDYAQAHRQALLSMIFSSDELLWDVQEDFIINPLPHEITINRISHLAQNFYRDRGFEYEGRQDPFDLSSPSKNNATDRFIGNGRKLNVFLNLYVPTENITHPKMEVMVSYYLGNKQFPIREQHS